ncbi:MAG: hypothetical protein AAF716_12735 [Cyanobacteria bacterium P01_D01_bin.1]
MTYSVETSLCHSLQQGKFCYVVEKKVVQQKGSDVVQARPSPHEQTLCERTRVEMHSRGYHSIVVQMRSLTISNPETQPTWDQQFIQAIWHSLHPTNPTQLSRWLATTAELSAKERLAAFTSDLLFNEICAMPFVLFIEDIDAFLSLDSIPEVNAPEVNASKLGIMEDVLFWIEYCYELRDTYLTYYHLSFAVFGSIPIDRMPPSVLDSFSSFESIIETFHQSDIKTFERSDVKRPGSRLDSYDSMSKHSHVKRRRHDDNGPTFVRSQYAKEIAKTQISAHRFDYDSYYCSRSVC